MAKPKPLLVDDEVLFTDNRSKLLARRGYEVSTVNDSWQALRVREEQEFDVVIVDQKMPGLDGLDVLRELKSKIPDLEIILLTGHGSLGIDIAGLQLGAYDFVRKPTGLSDLEDKIARAFDRRVLRKSKSCRKRRGHCAMTRPSRIILDGPFGGEELPDCSFYSRRSILKPDHDSHFTSKTVSCFGEGQVVMTLSMEAVGSARLTTRCYN